MPELPEVETTRRGIEPHLVGQQLAEVVLRCAKLRWPLERELVATLPGLTIRAVERRAKYLLLRLDRGNLLLHLGMSGSLRVLPQPQPPGRHDHVDLIFTSGVVLRLHDPRKFGALLWCPGEPLQHRLLRALGPEPLSDELNAHYLRKLASGRKQAVKPFIMSQQVIVGVGNIYASEALFRAGILPTAPAGSISLSRWQRLATAIKQVLNEAIEAGGTTLQDFTGGDGKPGYFKQQLQVYGRAGEPCTACHEQIRQIRLGQRSTYYCPRCQS